VPTSRAALFASAALTLLTATMAVPTLSQAQEDLRAQGDRACRGDARRLCRHGLGQGDGVVLSCFQAKRAQLSGSCRKFLTNVGQLN
jgi:hypothetical protein